MKENTKERLVSIAFSIVMAVSILFVIWTWYTSGNVDRAKVENSINKNAERIESMAASAPK